jgi:hypothetical protein
MRIAAFIVTTSFVAGSLAAQEFVPPKSVPHAGTRIGLFGFGVRGGVDVRDAGQLVMGTTIDLGDLFTDRLRIRPSAELGVFNGPATYVGSLEALWRFTADEEVATPYLGTGLGLAGRQDCSNDSDCPGLWVNVVFGFELRYRSTFNWLIEYHGMDALRRHRFYIGLTTRRGN